MSFKEKRALWPRVFLIQAPISGALCGADPGTPWILGAYGWREAFIITGAIGLSVRLIAWRYFGEHPDKHKESNERRTGLYTLLMMVRQQKKLHCESSAY